MHYIKTTKEIGAHATRNMYTEEGPTLQLVTMNVKPQGIVTQYHDPLISFDVLHQQREPGLSKLKELVGMLDKTKKDEIAEHNTEVDRIKAKKKARKMK